MEVARELFDLVLIAGSNADEAASHVLAQRVDSVILVASAGHTVTRSVEAVDRDFTIRRATLIGVVFLRRRRNRVTRWLGGSARPVSGMRSTDSRIGGIARSRSRMIQTRPVTSSRRKGSTSRMQASPDRAAVALRTEGAVGSSGLRSTTKEMARTAAKCTFAAADLFLRSWPGPRILIYHQIGAGSGRQMDLAPAVFRGHVDWLQSQGRIVGLGDALSGADDLDADRTFVLTFDDGYADFYENAFPYLERSGNSVHALSD